MMLTEPNTGCLEVEDKEYVYSLCAFNECRQRARHQSPGSGTRLGSWGRWIDHPADSIDWDRQRKLEELPYLEMMYDGGDACWNGPSRSVKVRTQFCCTAVFGKCALKWRRGCSGCGPVVGERSLRRQQTALSDATFAEEAAETEVLRVAWALLAFDLKESPWALIDRKVLRYRSGNGTCPYCTQLSVKRSTQSATTTFFGNGVRQWAR